MSDKLSKEKFDALHNDAMTWLTYKGVAPALADDMVSTAFLKCWQSYTKQEETNEQSFEEYIRLVWARAVRSVLVSHYRDSLRRPGAVRGADALSSVAGGTLAHHVFYTDGGSSIWDIISDDMHGDKAFLRKCLDNLDAAAEICTDIQLTILMTFYEAGGSKRDAGVILGYSEAYIGRTLRAIARKVQKFLPDLRNGSDVPAKFSQQYRKRLAPGQFDLSGDNPGSYLNCVEIAELYDDPFYWSSEEAAKDFPVVTGTVGGAGAFVYDAEETRFITALANVTKEDALDDF